MKTDEFTFTQNRDEFAQIRKLKSKIGMVHRLDKDTSGLMVIAKTENATEELSRQFGAREVFKSYVALVHGEVENEAGKIDTPIARDKHNRLRMCVRKNGRAALTLWKVHKRFPRFTLLNVEIKTGRTHQIRVHLAHIKHPVVGDPTYNEGRDKTISDPEIRSAIAKLGRVFLHAEKLGFTHPVTMETVNFTAPLSSELSAFLELL
jgi:23S rRNA pseudouridine1911/1915/1917 synthase